MLEIVMKAVLNTTSVKTQKNVKKFYVHLEMILLVRNVLYNFFLCLSLNLSTIFQTIIWWKYVWDQGYYIHINTNNISWHPPQGNHISHRQPQGLPGSISSPRSRRQNGSKMVSNVRSCTIYWKREENGANKNISTFLDQGQWYD